MAYNNNTPLASQRIKDTQQPIRDNFAELDTYTAVNHEALNSASAGKHKFLNLTVQGGAPANGATDISLFNMVSTLSGVRELFYAKGAGASVEITAGNGGGSGWTKLPSGIIVQWGQGSVIGNASLTFPKAFPTLCYFAVAGIEAPGATDVNKAVRVTAYNATTVTFYVSPRITTGTATAQVNYIAFGA